jgi:plasmid maintenance system antidote protein VapI
VPRRPAESVGDFLRRLIEENPPLTQERLADAIGAPRFRVNHWVNGRANPSPEYRAKLAAFFGEPPEEFNPHGERATLERLEEVVAEQMDIVRTIPGHLEGVTDTLREATETLKDVARRLSALETQQQRPAAPARRQRKSRP